MFDFSGDESLFFLIAAAASLAGGWMYSVPLAWVRVKHRSLLARLFLASIPILCALMTYLVAQTWGDSSVRNHPDYILLFMLGSLAWIFLSAFAMPLLGMSLRDDAVERDNRAAAIAGGAALLAVGIVYAASNVGAGSTIWTTLLSAVAATFSLGLIWLLIAAIGRSVIDNVTIDRDMATAVNVAGAMIGAAIILGRAAGGNWISWDQTCRDFLLRGWPAFALAFAAGCIGRFHRPTPERPRPAVMMSGFIPAAAYLGAAIVIVAMTSHGLDPSQW